MKIEQLSLFGFKIFAEQSFRLNGKSTIIFGINGTGKSMQLAGKKY